MFLYAWLHLSGYKVTLDDIKQFRQLSSTTPGILSHPRQDNKGVSVLLLRSSFFHKFTQIKSPLFCFIYDNIFILHAFITTIFFLSAKPHSYPCCPTFFLPFLQGHPEFHDTPGVEATTGPLGQGIGNAVGYAVALKMAAAHFNTPTHKLLDQKVVCLAGDGCIQEGMWSILSIPHPLNILATHPTLARSLPRTLTTITNIFFQVSPLRLVPLQVISN